MSPADVFQRYLDAWNKHDPDEIVSTFDEDGVYEDTSTGGPIRASKVGDLALQLFGAFPDLRFDVVTMGEMGDDSISAQWIMRGTNSGIFNGLPPTE